MFIPSNTKKILELYGIPNHSIIEIDDIIWLLSFIKSQRFYIGETSIKNKNNIHIRDVFVDNKFGEGISLDQDIMFLKLAKKGLLNVELYDVAINLNTNEGIDFYKFLSKYHILDDYYQNNKTGNTKYDLKKILNEEYESFIEHIYKNLFPGNIIPNEIDELNFEDRINIEVKLNSLEEFFIKSNKMFLHKSTLNYIKKKLIDEYNSNKDHIMFKLKNYYKGYGYIYELLVFLESKGILKIKDIIIKNSEKNSFCLYIKFKIKKIAKTLLPIFLETFQVEGKNRFLSEFKDGKLYIDKVKIKEPKGEKIKTIMKIIFSYRDYIGKMEFSYSELAKYFQDNIEDYKYFYDIINKHNAYENIKNLKKDEIEEFLLRKIFNKEYFKSSLGYENRNQKIFIYKNKTTGLLI